MEFTLYGRLRQNQGKQTNLGRLTVAVAGPENNRASEELTTNLAWPADAAISL
jgi:hypothetical protein